MDHMFKVRSKASGDLYFAEVTGITIRSDCSYDRWEVPSVYRVVAAKVAGYVYVPAEGVIGLTLDADSFWKQFERVTDENTSNVGT